MNRNFNKKNIIIYLLIIVIVLINYFAGVHSNLYSYLIEPAMWFLLFIITSFLYSDSSNRNKKNKDKVQLILIICLVYILFYGLSGLFFGYSKSIYKHDLFSILKNVWVYIPIIIFKELIRNKSVKNGGDNYTNFIIITLLFILTDISFASFHSYLGSRELLFKYSFQTLMPILFNNITLTYLATISDSKSGIIYRVVLCLIKILFPIYPDLDWFIGGLCEVVLAVVTFYLVHYYQTTNIIRYKNVRKGREKISLFGKIIGITSIVFFALFVGGFLKYQPIAVMSQSMLPVFDRGDVVVIRKVSQDELNTLEVGQILAYKNDKILVTHRITKLSFDENSNKIVIETKGDNNNNVDDIIITNEMVIGTVELRVPYIGYPSVFLTEFFNK